MPMVRESMTTGLCFSKAVNEAIGDRGREMNRHGHGHPDRLPRRRRDGRHSTGRCGRCVAEGRWCGDGHVHQEAGEPGHHKHTPKCSAQALDPPWMLFYYMVVR